MLQSKEWRACTSMVNYLKAHKPARFIHSYVLSVTQQYKHRIACTSAIYPAIMENMEDSLVKRVPHILMRESHNTSISAMSNSFHSIIVMRSVSTIFVSCIEAIMSKRKLSPSPLSFFTTTFQR